MVIVVVVAVLIILACLTGLSYLAMVLTRDKGTIRLPWRRR